MTTLNWHMWDTHDWAASRFSRWAAPGLDDRSWGFRCGRNQSMPRDFAKIEGPSPSRNTLRGQCPPYEGLFLLGGGRILEFIEDVLFQIGGVGDDFSYCHRTL
jgi:hypothetical protein